MIQADQQLARDLRASGTPHFFINGKRLTGAQPLSAFIELVDEQMAVAKRLVAEGVPKSQVYDTLLNDAATQAPQPAPPTRPAPRRAVVQSIPASPSHPTLGSAAAPVEVHVFSDFECPFCKRVLPTLEALRQQYPKQVKLVYHHLPLPFHRHAQPAARAALEAFAQRGSQGFWRMHDLLFQNQHALEDADLARYARQIGLDVARFRKALTDGRHDAALAADQQLAAARAIRGTPGFVTNGYFVSGAQPLATFTTWVDRALDDAKRGAAPSPPAP